MIPPEYELIAVCALVGKTPEELGTQPAWWYRQSAEYALARLRLEREERRALRSK